jgi:hypothetical protein
VNAAGHASARPPLRVFISSTARDLQDYRQAAFQAVQAMGVQGDDMLYWGADERSGATLSVDRVRACDVLLLLLAHRYGHVPEGAACSITEMEYRTALEQGVPVLAFLLHDDYPWPTDRIEFARQPQLEAFKSRVMNEVVCARFGSSDELGRLVTQALHGFLDRHRMQLQARHAFDSRALRVREPAALHTEPDLALHLGAAEDGLPLVLQIRRSRDLDPQLHALAQTVGIEDDALGALLGSFRQQVAVLARERWAQRGFQAVRQEHGAATRMYVCPDNLTQMFRASLGLLLQRAAQPAHWLPPSADEVPERTVIGAHSVPRQGGSVGFGATLQSEGGRNRFLAIDSTNGALSSVGRDFTGRWVRWREFRFESLLAADLGVRAQFGGPQALPHTLPLAELGPALLAQALHSADAQGVLPFGLQLRVPRQALLGVVAQVARQLSERHAQGRVHGDMKPDNVLLCAGGPQLIDAFDVPIGSACPGWTPQWSAPEQVLGLSVGPQADLYPLGRMLSDVLEGEVVGEVRKFKARPGDGRVQEFDIFYNPSVALRPRGPLADAQGQEAWHALMQQCLRFAPQERPSDATTVAERIETLKREWPVAGEVQVALGGVLRVCSLPDGRQVVARVIQAEADAAPKEAPRQPPRWVPIDTHPLPFA